MRTLSAKQRIYEQFARIGKALASPARLELLDLLTQGERSVEALATATDLSIANASQHLRVLAGARLVDSRRDAQRVFYRVADASVEVLWQSLRRAAENRLTELDAVARLYLRNRDALEPIDRHELLRRLRTGSIVLIDVRPVDEFTQGHLPGAVSVPLETVRAWAKRASKRRHVVAYCRGPYCVRALQAVEQLSGLGLRASRLEEGVAEWRAAGLPIETSVSAP